MLCWDDPRVLMARWKGEGGLDKRWASTSCSFLSSPLPSPTNHTSQQCQLLAPILPTSLRFPPGNQLISPPPLWTVSSPLTSCLLIQRVIPWRPPPILGHSTTAISSTNNGVTVRSRIQPSTVTGGRGGLTWQAHCEFVESF
jgi:hypothetical protein